MATPERIEALSHEAPAQAANADILHFPHPTDGDFSLEVHELAGSVRVPGSLAKVDYSLYMPSRPKSSHLHFAMPGFGGFKLSSDPFGQALAEQGRPSITYKPERFGGLAKNALKAQQIHADTISAIAEDVARHPELEGDSTLDLDQYVLLPHSMSGLSATKHAQQHPEQVAGMVYIAVVGLAGNRFITPHALRALDSARSEVGPALLSRKLANLSVREVLAQSIAYHGSNILQTSAEIYDCHRANIRPAQIALEELGVKRSLMTFGKDKLVDARATMSASAHLMNAATMIPWLNHLAPQTHPHETAVNAIRLIEQQA